MYRLIIVGGGISGLSAARVAADSARAENVPIEVTVLERRETWTRVDLGTTSGWVPAGALVMITGQ